MLFENASQYQKAKQTLLDNNRDVNKTVQILKKSPLFKDLSEGEIISQVAELNEGLGDTIMNFLSSAFGGDVSKIKTVLTQMKEQELKFNREEYEIYNEFYSLLQDQKALDKDKNNPDYQNLSRDIQQSRNALNTRMKELTKTHNEIFNALEEKIRDLVKDSNRKKKYFNAQRATDVLETKNDRYEKIKAVTAKSAARTQDLEDFFNVKVNDIEKDKNEAKNKAKEEVEKLSKTSTGSGESSPRKEGVYDQEPEKGFHDKLEKIKNTPGGFYAKRRALMELESDIFKALMDNDATITPENPHGDLGEVARNNINKIYAELEKITKQLEKEKESAEKADSAKK